MTSIVDLHHHLSPTFNNDTMAPSTRAAARRAPRVTDIESDYGSDLDEAAISDLLVRTDSQSLNQVDTLVLESLGGLDSLPVEARTSGSNALPDLRKRSWQRVQQDEAAAAVFNTAPLHEASIEVEYDECDNRADFIRKQISCTGSLCRH